MIGIHLFVKYYVNVIYVTLLKIAILCELIHNWLLQTNKNPNFCTS